MTTEEKLQHFTMYAMEEARNKSNTMQMCIRDSLCMFQHMGSGTYNGHLSFEYINELRRCV